MKTIQNQCAGQIGMGRYEKQFFFFFGIMFDFID